MTLGLATDTLDLDGKILRQIESDDVQEIRAADLFNRMQGSRTQAVPAFSAKKTKGNKQYQLARSGKPTEPGTKEVFISDFRMLRFVLPDIYFSMTCSKGTYVRAVSDEMGRELGCGAALSSLRRTRVGPFKLKDAINEAAVRFMSLQEIERLLR